MLDGQEMEWLPESKEPYVPKQYSAEFRQRVVELHRGGRSAPSISRDFGPCIATIYRWTAQERIDAGELPGNTSIENAELRRAKARIRELETELLITRKAAALFDENERPAPKGSTR